MQFGSVYAPQLALADYSARFDNTDVYRFLYASLFAQRPDSMLPLPGR